MIWPLIVFCFLINFKPTLTLSKNVSIKCGQNIDEIAFLENQAILGIEVNKTFLQFENAKFFKFTLLFIDKTSKNGKAKITDLLKLGFYEGNTKITEETLKRCFGNTNSVKNYSFTIALNNLTSNDYWVKIEKFRFEDSFDVKMICDQQNINEGMGVRVFDINKNEDKKSPYCLKPIEKETVRDWYFNNDTNYFGFNALKEPFSGPNGYMSDRINIFYFYSTWRESDIFVIVFDGQNDQTGALINATIEANNWKNENDVWYAVQDEKHEFDFKDGKVQLNHEIKGYGTDGLAIRYFKFEKAKMVSNNTSVNMTRTIALYSFNNTTKTFDYIETDIPSNKSIIELSKTCYPECLNKVNGQKNDGECGCFIPEIGIGKIYNCKPIFYSNAQKIYGSNKKAQNIIGYETGDVIYMIKTPIKNYKILNISVQPIENQNIFIVRVFKDSQLTQNVRPMCKPVYDNNLFKNEFVFELIPENSYYLVVERICCEGSFVLEFYSSIKKSQKELTQGYKHLENKTKIIHGTNLTNTNAPESTKMNFTREQIKDNNTKFLSISNEEMVNLTLISFAFKISNLVAFGIVFVYYWIIN